MSDVRRSAGSRSRCCARWRSLLYMTLYTGAGRGADRPRPCALGGARGLLLAPALWVAAEFARGHVLGGFPWIPLGSSMASRCCRSRSWPAWSASTALSFYPGGARRARGAGHHRHTRASALRAAAAAGVALLAAVSVWGGLRVADARAHARRHAADRRTRAGQHPPGREVGSAAWPARSGGATTALTRQRRGRRRAGGAVAGVGDAVSLQRRRRCRPRPCARWCARPACRCSSAPTRSSAARPTATTTRRSCSTRPAPWPPSTARCSWCRSASSCRCRRLLFFVAPLVEARVGLLAGRAR